MRHVLAPAERPCCRASVFARLALALGQDSIRMAEFVRHLEKVAARLAATPEPSLIPFGVDSSGKG
jgi:hypothetical protein